jgi:hypothetical protein
MEEIFAAAETKYQKQKKSMGAKAQAGGRLKTMLSNYPGDLANLVKGAAKGAYQVARHPVKTLDDLMIGAAKNVIIPGAGAFQKATGLGGESAIPAYEDAKKRLLSSRYGSPAKFAEYMEKNPAQAQADIALMLTGGGKAIQAGGKMARAGALQKAGTGIMKAGAMVEPITAPFKIAGEAARPFVPSRMAQKMYASSAKMSTVMDPDVRQRLSQRLLDAEVKLNNKGFKKLADDFEAMWRGVDGLIDEYVTKGPNEKRTVLDLLDGIDEWEKRAQLTGRSHIVRGVKKKFINDLTETVKIGDKNYRVLKELDAQQINQAKRDLYSELHSKYGKDMVPLAAALKMTIAHNAMLLIEDLIPGVIPKNKTAAAYKEMMDVIKNGVNRIENRDLFSIGMPVRAGGTAVISEALGVDAKLGGIGGLVLGMIDLPSVKSKLAIRINKLKKQGIEVSPTATAIKVGLVKAEDIEEKRNPIYPKEWTIQK